MKHEHKFAFPIWWIWKELPVEPPCEKQAVSVSSPNKTVDTFRTNLAAVIIPKNEKNQVQSAELEKAENVTSLQRTTRIMYRYTTGCTGCIDSMSVLFPGKTHPSIL